MTIQMYKKETSQCFSNRKKKYCETELENEGIKYKGQ